MSKQDFAVSPNTNLSTPPVEVISSSERTDLAKSVSRLRTMLVVALLTSGAAGLAVNLGLGSQRRAETAKPTLLASAGDVTAATTRPPQVLVSEPRAQAALRFRKVDTTAPDDPFEPTLPPVEPALQVAPAATAPKTGIPLGGAPIEAAAQAAADAAAPTADQISLVGIIQGDPALAVVKYDGQSFFLKVGEQVADTWRLEQIGERSATFSLGKRRVEVPLREGSSS